MGRRGQPLGDQRPVHLRPIHHIHPILVWVAGEKIEAESQNDYSMCGVTEGLRVHSRVVRGRVEAVGRPEGTIHESEVNWCQDCVAAVVEQQLAKEADEP